MIESWGLGWCKWKKSELERRLLCPSLWKVIANTQVASSVKQWQFIEYFVFGLNLYRVVVL